MGDALAQLLEQTAPGEWLLHALDGRAGGTERGHRAGQEVEDEEGTNWRDVDAADGWDDTAEEVEVDVRCRNRTKTALPRLREHDRRMRSERRPW